MEGSQREPLDFQCADWRCPQETLSMEGEESGGQEQERSVEEEGSSVVSLNTALCRHKLGCAPALLPSEQSSLQLRYRSISRRNTFKSAVRSW